MNLSFLQSKEWAEFQRSLGRAPNETVRARSVPLSRTGREVLEYPNLEVEPLSKVAQPPAITAKIIKHDLPFGKNYLYIPHGPEMDFNQMTGGLKNPVTNFVRWLREEAKKRKSIFVKAEPLIDSVAQAIVEAGFRKSKKEIQPSKTVVIDLAQSEDELLSVMHHKTRYNIRVADKHNVVVAESDDIEQFLKLLKKTAKRDKFHAHPADYYRKLINFRGLETKLYFAKHGENLVAAALILIFGDTAYYLHGASDYERRSLMAPYALHWNIIKDLKSITYNSRSAKPIEDPRFYNSDKSREIKSGLKPITYYDLWGIDAKKWPGVTRFKLGWVQPNFSDDGKLKRASGGHVVEYPGSFDLTTSRFWHLIYKAIQRL